ncbi:hypothetical protein GCM10022200_06940 [Microbacterium awajiense]|uniref:Uncharacterized protein n=1 Tax=Microbacterium awajiense TaxID=415214 RepID=A0ABP7A932_9MICO
MYERVDGRHDTATRCGQDRCVITRAHRRGRRREPAKDAPQHLGFAQRADPRLILIASHPDHGTPRRSTPPHTGSLEG